MPSVITMSSGKLNVPNDPIIPFIEGDGTGPDIWRASVRVFDEVVKKVYGADGMPNFEKKYHILHRQKHTSDLSRDLKMTEAQIEAKLEPLRKKLFDARSLRDRPGSARLRPWAARQSADRR